VAEADRQPDTKVVEMVDYLRDTLREMDEGIAEMSERRHGIAVRLAVLEAAVTPAVQDAELDFEIRRGAPYKGEDAGQLLSEAHKRFGS